MEEIVDYLIDFLLGREGFRRYVDYSDGKSVADGARLVIRRSGYLDSDTYGRVSFPLKSVEKIPVLFGGDKVCVDNGICRIDADLIASAYYMLARVDELVDTRRDEHGRYLAKYSVAYKGNFMRRPILEEYGALMRSKLREVGVDIPEPDNRFSVVMSHDLDIPFRYRLLRGFASGVLHGDIRRAFRVYMGKLSDDPFLASMRRMVSVERKKKSVRSVMFLKVAGWSLEQDKPYYNPYSSDIREYLRLCDNVGLHLSYQSGLNMINAASEKSLAESVTGKKITSNRNHYLATLAPDDMDELERIGITDDYTVGYADYAGFRLGTCRPVRYINPVTRTLHKLVLHPLAVMDCSLERKCYMNLSYSQALRHVMNLRKTVERYGGELNLLWHNNLISRYNVDLYNALMKSFK